MYNFSEHRGNKKKKKKKKKEEKRKRKKVNSEVFNPEVATLRKEYSEA
jgi:hypothetical protein